MRWFLNFWGCMDLKYIFSSDIHDYFFCCLFFFCRKIAQIVNASIEILMLINRENELWLNTALLGLKLL